MVTLRDFINRLKRYNDWMWLNWGYNLVTSNLIADKLTVTEVAALTKTLNTQNNIPQTWVYTRQCWHTGNSVIKTSNKLDAKEMTKKTKTKQTLPKRTARNVPPAGYVPILNKNSMTFQGRISHFPRTSFSAKKSLKSMSFLVLPKHEQLYPEGLSVFAPFCHLRIWIG